MEIEVIGFILGLKIDIKIYYYEYCMMKAIFFVFIIFCNNKKNTIDFICNYKKPSCLLACLV